MDERVIQIVTDYVKEHLDKTDPGQLEMEF